MVPVRLMLFGQERPFGLEGSDAAVPAEDAGDERVRHRRNGGDQRVHVDVLHGQGAEAVFAAAGDIVHRVADDHDAAFCDRHAEAGRAALRPVARASLGTLRTPSMFGFLAPEVGLRSTFGPRGTDFTVGWSLFPIEWRASGALVVGVEPLLATWRVGLDHRGGTGELSAGLTFRVAP